ncbi:hypothetical protein [Streptomyces sp. AM 2-1-1]|uniref:hypothetical protein n=1 Tax=Streptomyces sp. AM 2-1-1 TaxID=3028709 RepID=UPI0023BA1603|nr:hypothetical protein [Streptomyces sp. AM 2-1-1]WEH40640.1 hypothetical protein PZB77_14640 [Streptomyces sp. AM 2-1-1]
MNRTGGAGEDGEGAYGAACGSAVYGGPAPYGGPVYTAAPAYTAGPGTYGVAPYDGGTAGGPGGGGVPMSRAELAADVRLALDLARGRATGEAADALRARLRRAIVAFAPQADAYAAQLADSRAREIVTHMVCHAWAVAQDPGQDPAVNLRLLAKAVDHLARYAAAARHMAPVDGEQSGAC